MNGNLNRMENAEGGTGQGLAESGSGEVVELSLWEPGEPTWESVRRWVNWAIRYRHGALALQVMAGFGLLKLHAECRVKRGRPRRKKDTEAREFEAALRRVSEKIEDPVKRQEFLSVGPAMAQMRADLEERVKKLRVVKGAEERDRKDEKDLRNLNKAGANECAAGLDEGENKLAQTGPITWKEFMA